MRNGRAAAVPFLNTVSMWAISRTLPLPVPENVATMLSPPAGAGVGKVSIVAPSRLQLFDGDGADGVQPLGVAGAGIDVDQPLPELDRAGLVALGAVQDRLVGFGGDGTERRA